MNSATIVQKLWNYCNVVRDDGMRDGDYVEQLTYLLFVEMAHERPRLPVGSQMSQPNPIPEPYAWLASLARDAGALFNTCRHAPA